MLTRVLHLVLIALGSLVGLSLCAPVHATTYPTFDLLSHSNAIGSNGDYEIGGTPNTKISSTWISNYDSYNGSADGYVIGSQGKAQAYSHAFSPQYIDGSDFDPTDYAESKDSVTVTDIGPAPKGSTSITIKMQLTGSYTEDPGADGSFAAAASAYVQLIDLSRSGVSAITEFSTSSHKYPALPHTLSATISGVEGDDEIQVIYYLEAFTYINGNIYFLTHGDTLSDSLVDVSHTARIFIDTDNGAFIASNGYDYSSPAVPIPGTLLLFGTGLLGLAASKRRFNR